MICFTFNADVYCEDCGHEIQRLRQEYRTVEDSCLYPQSYDNNFAEADYPHHCGNCDLFLGNPLTSDGRKYVLESVYNYLMDKHGNIEILIQWIEFYRIEFSELFDYATRRN